MDPPGSSLRIVVDRHGCDGQLGQATVALYPYLEAHTNHCDSCGSMELTNCAVVALAAGFSRNLRLTAVSSLSWATSHGLPYSIHEATGRFAFVGQGEIEECSSEDGQSKREGKGSYHVFRPSASAFVQIDTEEALELELVGETMRVFGACT